MRGLRNSYVVVRGKSKWNIHALHSKHTKGIHTKYIHHRSLKSTFVWKIAIFNSHQISNFGLFTEFDLCSETVTYCWLRCSNGQREENNGGCEAAEGMFSYKFKEGHSKNFKRELPIDFFINWKHLGMKMA